MRSRILSISADSFGDRILPLAFHRVGIFSGPVAIVALGAICAETDAEAHRLAASSRLLIRRIRSGDLRAVPSPEDALRELAAVVDPEPPTRTEFPRYVVGEPAEVRDKLIDIASVLQLEELMIVTIVYDHGARKRSYELLADAFSRAPVA